MAIFSVQKVVPVTVPDGSVVEELASPKVGSIQSHSLARITLPPGVVVKRHYHKSSEEVYFITEGEAEISLGNESEQVDQGSIVTIPRLEWHSIKNTGQVPLVMIVTCCPAWVPEDTFF